MQACNRFDRNNHAMEMANLSQAVYNDSGAPEGWTRLSDPDKLSSLPPNLRDPELWNNTKTNYHAGLFQSGDGHIVMAERGTNPKDWDDVKTDIEQGWSGGTPQYIQGTKVSRLVKQDFGDQFSYLTGHSLGGGRAAADSAVTGIPATTFNAAGLNGETIAPYHVTLQQAASKVQNFNVDGQILNDLKGLTIGKHTSPDPLGSNIPLPAVDPLGNALSWPVPPKPVKDTWNPIQQGEHAGDYVKYEKAIVTDGIDRHGIDKVQNALEKQKVEDAAHITHALQASSSSMSSHRTSI